MTAIVVCFPPGRIVRDRQAKIEMRKAFQLNRRRHPKQTPSQWWEAAAVAEAIKAVGDQRSEVWGDLRNLGAMTEGDFEALLERVARRSQTRPGRGEGQPLTVA